MSDYRFDVCIFAAVSTPGQATQDKTSLDTQLQKCREWCRQGGHRIVEEITVPGHSRSYFDLDDLVHDCKEYAQMLDLARTRKINLVLCPIFDRLWRTPVLEAQVTQVLKAYGVQSQSLQQPVPLLPPDQVSTDVDAGDLIRMLSGYLGRIDTQTRLWRVKEARQKRVTEKGLHYGTCRLFGWKSVGRKEPWVQVPEEIRWYLTTMDWIEQGISLTQIEIRLAEAGVVGTRGGPIDRKSIRRLAINPFYAGGVRLKTWEKNPITGEKRLLSDTVNWDGAQHEPVIPRERWERIQEIITSRWSPKNHWAMSDTPLVGLVRCGVCGLAMTYNKSGGRFFQDDGSQYWLLRCSSTPRRRQLAALGRKVCDNKGYPERRVLMETIEEVRRILTNPAVYAQVKQAAHREQGELGGELLLLQLAGIDQRIQRVSRAIQMTDALESLVGSLKDLEATKRLIVAKLEEAQQAKREWNEFQRNALDLHGVLGHLHIGADGELLHSIFSRLFKVIYLSPAGIRFEILA